MRAQAQHQEPYFEQTSARPGTRRKLHPHAVAAPVSSIEKLHTIDGWNLMRTMLPGETGPTLIWQQIGGGLTFVIPHEKIDGNILRARAIVRHSRAEGFVRLWTAQPLSDPGEAPALNDRIHAEVSKLMREATDGVTRRPVTPGTGLAARRFAINPFCRKHHPRLPCQPHRYGPRLQRLRSGGRTASQLWHRTLYLDIRSQRLENRESSRMRRRMTGRGKGSGSDFILGIRCAGIPPSSIRRMQHMLPAAGPECRFPASCAAMCPSIGKES